MPPKWDLSDNGVWDLANFIISICRAPFPGSTCFPASISYTPDMQGPASGFYLLPCFDFVDP